MLGAVGERGDQPVRQVPRVRRDEAQAPDGRPPVGRAQPIDGAQQLGEVRPAVQVQPMARPARLVDVPEARLGRQVVAVGVDVLAEQRDLVVARRRERSGLVHDLVERAAPLGAAAERHDAVGAGLVAAVDDRQPGADRRAAGHGPGLDGRRAGRRQPVRDADRGPVHDRRATDGADGRLRGRQAEPVDELGLLVGPQEQVDRRVAAAQPVALRLAHRAAGQHDAETGVLGLELPELPLAADDLLLGALADRAGVDDDEVRVVEAGRLRASGLEQAPGHLLRVAAVHLAAERPHVEPRQGAGLREVLGEALVVGRGRATRIGHGRRRQDLEHRQRAVERGSVGHGRADCTPSAARTPSATDAGTQR